MQSGSRLGHWTEKKVVMLSSFPNESRPRLPCSAWLGAIWCITLATQGSPLLYECGWLWMTVDPSCRCTVVPTSIPVTHTLRTATALHPGATTIPNLLISTRKNTTNEKSYTLLSFRFNRLLLWYTIHSVTITLYSNWSELICQKTLPYSNNHSSEIKRYYINWGKTRLQLFFLRSTGVPVRETATMSSPLGAITTRNLPISTRSITEPSVIACKYSYNMMLTY